MIYFLSKIGLKQIREIRAGKIESGNEWHDFMRGHDLAKKVNTHFFIYFINILKLVCTLSCGQLPYKNK